MTVDSGQRGANEDLEGLTKRSLPIKVLREPQKHPARKGNPFHDSAAEIGTHNEQAPQPQSQE